MKTGHDISKLGSVASFFISRVDTEVDKRLDKIGSAEAKALKGEGRDRQRATCLPALRGEVRLRPLGDWPPRARNRSAPCGPRPSTKDPSLPDTIYVTELVAPGTVNTMPEATLQATYDHGDIPSDSVRGHYAEAKAVLDKLAAVGVDYDDVVLTLENEGLEKFEASWIDLIAAVQKELDEKAGS